MIALISVEATSSNSTVKCTILRSFLFQFQQKISINYRRALNMTVERLHATIKTCTVTTAESNMRAVDSAAISEEAQSSSNQPSPLKEAQAVENRSPASRE